MLVVDSNGQIESRGNKHFVKAQVVNPYQYRSSRLKYRSYNKATNCQVQSIPHRRFCKPIAASEQLNLKFNLTLVCIPLQELRRGDSYNTATKPKNSYRDRSKNSICSKTILKYDCHS